MGKQNSHTLFSNGIRIFLDKVGIAKNYLIGNNTKVVKAKF
jgi:hypothetical protein